MKERALTLRYQIQIHPLRPQGAAMVPIRDVTVAVATSDGEGHGHVDVLVAGMDGKIRDLFERPREVKDASGKVLRVLKPWTHESLKYLLSDGLHREGLTGERADGP